MAVLAFSLISEALAYTRMTAVRKLGRRNFSSTWLRRGKEVRRLHDPVLYAEVMERLCKPKYNTFIDATFGAGGHTLGLLAGASPTAKVYTVDRDWTHTKDRVNDLKLVYADRFEPVSGRFGNLGELMSDRGVGPSTVGAILFDVGVSSMQLDTANRGFSFLRSGPLDMRMDPTDEVTAADLVNNMSEHELRTVIRKLGEEPQAARISHKICLERMKTPIVDTVQLADIVSSAVIKKKNQTPSKYHPATKTFQAIRILLNKEIEELHNGLADAVTLLAPGGTVAVITFHSLESRIVKSIMKKLSETTQSIDGSILPPLLTNMSTEYPSEVEIATNPRSRSALLRCAVRTKAPSTSEYFSFLANTPRT
eukprot:CFRG6408T1